MLHPPWRHAFPCRAHGGGLDTGRKAYFGRQASGAVARMTPVPSGPPARAGKAISEAGRRGEAPPAPARPGSRDHTLAAHSISSAALDTAPPQAPLSRELCPWPSTLHDSPTLPEGHGLVWARDSPSLLVQSDTEGSGATRDLGLSEPNRRKPGLSPLSRTSGVCPRRLLVAPACARSDARLCARWPRGAGCASPAVILENMQLLSFPPPGNNTPPRKSGAEEMGGGRGARKPRGLGRGEKGFSLPRGPASTLRIRTFHLNVFRLVTEAPPPPSEGRTLRSSLRPASQIQTPL